MKKIKILPYVFFALIAAKSTAQDLPVNEKTGKVTFMNVVETKNITEKEIYDVVKKWAPKYNLTITDDISGERIYFKGAYDVSYPSVKGGISDEGKIEFVLQTFFKDGKYRYIVTDFVHKSKMGDGGNIESVEPQCGLGKMTLRAWNIIKNKTYTNTNKMTEELSKAIQEFMNDPARSDDW